MKLRKKKGAFAGGLFRHKAVSSRNSRLQHPLGTIRLKRKKILPKLKSRSAPRILFNWKGWGEQVGREDALHHPKPEDSCSKKMVNNQWLARIKEKSFNKKSWPHYCEAVKGYLEGYSLISGINVREWMLLPTERTVSVVISVMNEEATVMNVLHQLQRMPLEEIIVVVNGSGDSTFQRVRKGSSAIVVYYPEPLGYDVGRAIGSKLTGSDIVVYVDGDMTIAAEQLIPFIAAIDRGADVALNHISPYLRTFAHWDGVSMVKQLINVSLGRPDLGADSLTAVPHALSRKALDTIGIEQLMVPPKAQALAIAKGLVVTAPWSVDVITTNRVNQHNKGANNSVSDMIIGDHIEALHAVQQLGGERLSFTDLIRKRSYLV
ncbi:glycosyltransferase [Paenibacillus sp. 1_12]|uniref:glycosyltransferase family 2 protein n=1 Tax=Paenibacillus sp. 1_12 TaxID=1566278 RepID=UPI000AEF1BDA|nr:glycosyltransferase [Paenibacillus sp. 1_12]